ncbi:unnamed protein product, partial [Pylaiella littoralis]
MPRIFLPAVTPNNNALLARDTQHQQHQQQEHQQKQKQQSAAFEFEGGSGEESTDEDDHDEDGGSSPDLLRYSKNDVGINQACREQTAPPSRDREERDDDIMPCGNKRKTGEQQAVPVTSKKARSTTIGGTSTSTSTSTSTNSRSRDKYSTASAPLVDSNSRGVSSAAGDSTTVGAGGRRAPPQLSSSLPRPVLEVPPPA